MRHSWRTQLGAINFNQLVYDGVLYHTLLGRFSEVNCSTTKRVPTANDTPSEGSDRCLQRRHGHYSYSNCGGSGHQKSAQGGGIYTNHRMIHTKQLSLGLLPEVVRCCSQCEGAVRRASATRRCRTRSAARFPQKLDEDRTLHYKFKKQKGSHVGQIW